MESMKNYEKLPISDPMHPKGKYLVMDQRYIGTNTSNRLKSDFLCYAYAFKYYGSCVHATSLSSHPLELPFGRIREGSIGNDTTEMVSNIIAKRIFRYHLLDNLGHNESAVKGICENARSSFSQGWNIDIPKEIDCSKIQNEIM